MAAVEATTPAVMLAWYSYNNYNNSVTGNNNNNSSITDIHNTTVADYYYYGDNAPLVPGGVNTNATSAVAGNRTRLVCDDWRDAQHVLFQLANLCFCVSFLAPAGWRCHLLLVRGVLSVGCLFLAAWGAAVVCQADILGWYLAFLAINATHLGLVARRLCPARLEARLERVYARSFRPLRVSRSQFRKLASQARVVDQPAGTSYALEGCTRSGQGVALLLSGRMKVSHEEVFLHFIEPCEFVDSPEYEAVPRDDDCDTFQVSICALEDSLYLTWPLLQLQLYLKSDPFISTIFTNIVGKDITHKLYQVQELLARPPHNPKVLAGRGSLVQVRKHLTQNLSTHNLRLHLNVISVPNHVSDETQGEADQDDESDAWSRVPTPVGPYSPSQVSFETCV